MPAIKPVNYKILLKIFVEFGCIQKKIKGDHIILSHPEVIRPVVIPKYNEIPVFIIKNNMRIVKMTNEKYFELYNKNK